MWRLVEVFGGGLMRREDDDEVIDLGDCVLFGGSRSSDSKTESRDGGDGSWWKKLFNRYLYSTTMRERAKLPKYVFDHVALGVCIYSP